MKTWSQFKILIFDFMMRRLLIFFGVVMAAVPAFGENYLLNGGQESQIQYQMMQKIQPSAGIKKLVLSFVVPESFLSPTYNQKITDLDFNFLPPPSTREDRTDQRGNKVIEVSWKSPPGPVKTTIRLTAVNSTKLQALQTSAPFPLSDLPQPIKEYLKATDQVPAGAEQIQSKARELTRAASNEFDAVQTILTWVVDHMHYVLTPQSYDALYSFHSGKGNCQNYSHLAAALMRAVGIPVRIVNGITLKQPYDINLQDSILTMKMAQGRTFLDRSVFPGSGLGAVRPPGNRTFC